MKLVASVILLLLMVLLAMPVSANRCQQLTASALKERLTRHNIPTVQVPELVESISVYCSEEVRASARGFTKPDFATGKISIFLRDNLPSASFNSTLEHELQHAVQYFQWLNAQSDSSLASAFTDLASMMKPGKFNGSFQVRAGLKKHPTFKSQPKKWLQAYTNVFFCMEYQAYHLEAEYVKFSGIEPRYISQHVTQYLTGDPSALAEFLNKTVVKQYWDSQFTSRQLALALQSCSESNDPVDMFRASVEALNLSFSNQ